jgi:hypothetical protein
VTGRKSKAPSLGGEGQTKDSVLSTSLGETKQTPFQVGCDPDYSFRANWLNSPSGQGVQEEGLRLQTKLSLRSLSPEQADSKHSRTGEGKRRGKWQGGIGKAAGGVKICRWRDVRMPGEMKDPDPRNWRKLGEWTQGPTMGVAWTPTQLRPSVMPCFRCIPGSGLQGWRSGLPTWHRHLPLSCWGYVWRASQP